MKVAIITENLILTDWSQENKASNILLPPASIRTALKTSTTPPFVIIFWSIALKSGSSIYFLCLK